MNQILVLISLCLSPIALAIREEDALATIECVRKAMNGGIPSLIPDFHPLRLEDFTFQYFRSLISINMSVTHIVIEDLADFQVENIRGVPRDDSNGVVFNYDIFWPKVRVSADYAHDIIFRKDIKLTAHINTTFENVCFNGTWNMTTGRHPRLEEFHLDLSAVNITDYSDTIPVTFGYLCLAEFLDKYLGTSLSFADLVDVKSNHSLLGDLISPDLQQTINDKWIVGGHNKFGLIWKNCQRQISWKN